MILFVETLKQKKSFDDRNICQNVYVLRPQNKLIHFSGTAFIMSNLPL